MPRPNHSHWEGGPPCDLPTKKACDDRHADWQAAQQVALAARIAREGRAQAFRKDRGVFAQLVLVMAGEQPTILNGDGNESENPFTRRLLAMVERYRAETPPVESPEVH